MLATSLGPPAALQGSVCVCGDTWGATARCWPPNVLFWGQTLGQPAATEEGELGRATGPGDEVAPQGWGCLGGVRSWTLPWEASVELSLHKLISKAALGAL